jgi:hypothetical protein
MSFISRRLLYIHKTRIACLSIRSTNSYALLAHEKLVLLGLSWIAFPDTYSPRPHWTPLAAPMSFWWLLTMHPAIPKMKTLRIVSSVFVTVEKYRPLFMNSQKTALIPSAYVSASHPRPGTGMRTSRPAGEEGSLEHVSRGWALRERLPATYHQGEEILKDRNRLGDNPGDNPQGRADARPVSK